MRGDGFLSRLWREARRRRLPSILLAYPAGAWFCIEAVPRVLGNLGADAGTTAEVESAITILAVAAFPLVMMLTWMFQVVPHADAPEDAGAPHRFRRFFLASSVIVVSAGCVTLATLLWPPVSAADEPPAWWASRSLDQDALALLPPRVLMGDEEAGRVADCVAYRLRDRLAAVRGLSVRGPAETEWLAVEGLPPDSLAARLGVGVLITSTVEELAEGLRMTFRILDASGRQLESVSDTQAMPSADRTFEALVDRLEVAIRGALGRVRGEDLLTEPSGAPEAQEPFLQAEQEMEIYRRLLAAGEVDAAVASMERADDLLARAAEADRSWVEPVNARARIHHNRATLLLTNDRPAAVAAHRESLRLAEEALDRAPGDPEALRLRGQAALEIVATDRLPDERRTALLDQADGDLRRSQSRHRNRAGVRYLLSTVMEEQGRLTEALAFARDAYEGDAYFSLSHRVLRQLFDLSFQLALDGEASAWCEEGGRRFPGQWDFAACRIALMGWGAAPPDTAAAHALVEQALAAYPPPFRGVLRPELETLAAAVHAQAGDDDGARSILALTPLAASPAVHVTAAGVWLLLGEEDQALAQLRRYVARAPGEAHHLPGRRILRPLAGDPRFVALVEGDPRA
ncbi:MAG: hypothetical protein AMXMBFR53_03930 [Gemmatimonadota bacterium]